MYSWNIMQQLLHMHMHEVWLMGQFVHQRLSTSQSSNENRTFIGLNIYKNIEAKNISSVHFLNGKTT